MAPESSLSSLIARTGRHRQRYDEDNQRLVSGCIPYRLRNKDGDESNCQEDRLEVVMVSTPNRHDLIFPKGGWETDETAEEAAHREAFEEAGVRGIIKEELGDWQFRSKRRENLGCLEGGCKGYIFALEVTEELQSWPEQENHERKWLRIKDAFKLCRYEWMREALEKFLQFMDREHNIEIEQQDDHPTAAMPNVVPDRTNKSPNCWVTPSSSELHGIGALVVYTFAHPCLFN
ncbi:hypothetical protein Ancab_026442 [Ancistrocladus abbreviatus]